MMQVYVLLGSDMTGNDVELLGVFGSEDDARGRRDLHKRDNDALGIRQYFTITKREVE